LLRFFALLSKRFASSRHLWRYGFPAGIGQRASDVPSQAPAGDGENGRTTDGENAPLDTVPTVLIVLAHAQPCADSS
jgi:hypothetical protein